MNDTILNKLLLDKRNGKKSFAVLIDPDEYKADFLPNLVEKAHIGKIDYFFVGGSLVMGNEIDACVKELKSLTDIPVILFPSSAHQITDKANALLFLSLISGRNADLLIGKHVETAPLLYKTSLEILSTGYMLVDGGQQTTASYISNTNPLPNNKPKIAQATALAGEYLGMQLIYLDAGSGAKNKVSDDLIKAISEVINLPIIVGGGLNSIYEIENSCRAGADVIVVGNAIEKDDGLLIDFANSIHNFNEINVI